jgi:uncharacterized membrane protein YwaF
MYFSATFLKADVSTWATNHIKELEIMEQLESISISLSLFLSITIVIIAILNFILKNRLISSGQTDPEILKSLSQSFNHKIAVLKWGFILLFGGIGLVVINFIPDARTVESPLPYGIEMIFLAAGFLCYYLTVKQNEKNINH